MADGLMIGIYGDSISISQFYPGQASGQSTFLHPPPTPGPTRFYIELLLALNKEQEPVTKERPSHGPTKGRKCWAVVMRVPPRG